MPANPEIGPVGPPAVLCERDAAIYICMSKSWLAQARCDGNLPGRTPAPPHLKLGARRIGYLVKDLDQWLEERRVVDGSL